MGLPNINITFREASASVIRRGERGVVALILEDDALGIEPFEVITSDDIPETLSDFNRDQIEKTMLGYRRPPRRIIVYVVPTGDEVDYAPAKAYLETVRWNFLAVPNISSGDATAMETWIKGLRDTRKIKVKAVLPNTAADHEGIINFTTDNIVVGDRTYTTAEYCARIAGLLAGTPIDIASTFAPLPEVDDHDKMTDKEYDQAIDRGELVLYYDGEKTKVGRGVNSLQTLTDTKGKSFKKIKIVDAMDLIYDDIRITAEDEYIGKYANSYDNKCLLIVAIQTYLEGLETAGVLQKDMSDVRIDMEKQMAYLKENGVNVDELSLQEIKEANTDDKVFLVSDISILDAIEEITLDINI